MQPSSTCHDAIVLAVALFFSTFAKSELVPPENPTYSEMGYPTPGDVIDTSANASGNNRCTNQDFGGFIPEAACMSDGAWHPSTFSIEAARCGRSSAECVQDSTIIFEDAQKRIRLEPRGSTELAEPVVVNETPNEPVVINASPQKPDANEPESLVITASPKESDFNEEPSPQKTKTKRPRTNNKPGPNSPKKSSKKSNRQRTTKDTKPQTKTKTKPKPKPNTSKSDGNRHSNKRETKKTKSSNTNKKTKEIATPKSGSNNRPKSTTQRWGSKDTDDEGCTECCTVMKRGDTHVTEYSTLFKQGLIVSMYMDQRPVKI